MCPAPGTTASSARGQQGGHTLGGGDELGVEGAGDEEDRHGERHPVGPTSVPGCRSRRGAGSTASPAAVLARRSSTPARSTGRLANSGWPIHHSRNAGTPSALDLDRPAPRQPAAGRSGPPGRRARPWCSRGRAGSTRAGAATARRRARRTAHRVADVRGPAGGPPEGRRAVGQVEPNDIRVAVAGSVDGDGLVRRRRGRARTGRHERRVCVKPWTRTATLLRRPTWPESSVVVDRTVARRAPTGSRRRRSVAPHAGASRRNAPTNCSGPGRRGSTTGRRRRRWARR